MRALASPGDGIVDQDRDGGFLIARIGRSRFVDARHHGRSRVVGSEAASHSSAARFTSGEKEALLGCPCSRSGLDRPRGLHRLLAGRLTGRRLQSLPLLSPPSFTHRAARLQRPPKSHRPTRSPLPAGAAGPSRSLTDLVRYPKPDPTSTRPGPVRSPFAAVVRRPQSDHGARRRYEPALSLICQASTHGRPVSTRGRNRVGGARRPRVSWQLSLHLAGLSLKIFLCV